MATLTVSGNNASYTLSLSGMSTSTRYHVFIADLSSSGSVTGYKCVRSSLGTSSTWTYNGKSSSPYSNYGRSVYVYTSTAATSHSVGSTYTYDQMRSGCTFMDSDTIPAGSGSTTYDTNALNLRTGTGISSYSVKYLGSTGSTSTTATVSNSSASTVCYTRASTNLEVTDINYADGYGAPFYFIEYTSSSFSTVKKTFSDNDSNVLSSGTRYVKLFGTPRYAIHLRTGVGINSYAVSYTTPAGATQTATVSNKSASTVCWCRGGTKLQVTSIDYETNYTAPFRFTEYNSTFSSALSNFADNDAYVTANANRYLKISGTYQEPQYTIYLRCGPGVKNFSVYRDGEYVSLNSSTTWTPVNLTESKKTVTIKLISHEDGYGTPDYVNFYASASASSPYGSIQGSSGSFSIEYTSNRQYCQISATKQKTPIDLFYWESAAWDAANIAKGKPVSNMTAARWNKLLAKIKELAEAEDGSFSYSTVNPSTTFYASQFNAARLGISNRTGCGTLPATQSAGNEVKAALFEGDSGSLKSALNAAITYHNNS